MLPETPKGRLDRWSNLQLAIGICFALVVLITIPVLPRIYQEGPGVHAALTLQAINDAQTAYYSTHSRFAASLSQLAAGSGAGAESRFFEHGRLSLWVGTQRRYVLSMRGGADYYSINADPPFPEETQLHLYTDASGVIRLHYSRPAGPTDRVYSPN